MSARGETRLWLAQRGSAAVLALCVLVHLVTMIVAVNGGLTATDILARTRGNPAWAVFYALFVIAVSIHAPIGLRTIGSEWAFLVHRLSGLLLALFLPLHFLALGRALAGAAALDDFLRWTEQPMLKASEVALVFLLAAHLAGGMRLLFVEFAGWRRQAMRGWVAVAAGLAMFCALAFALNLY